MTLVYIHYHDHVVCNDRKTERCPPSMTGAIETDDSMPPMLTATSMETDMPLTVILTS